MTVQFAATQKVSGLAECKPECKDLQQAEELAYKTFSLVVILRLCYLKRDLSLHF